MYTLFLVLVIPLIVNAQKQYRQFSIGIGTGLARNHGDLRVAESRQVYMGNLEYFFNPYLVANGELVVGSMAAKGLASNRAFLSNFGAGTANLKVYFGRYIDRFRGPMYRRSSFSSVLSGVYFGAGLGAIKSSQREIVRSNHDPMYRGWNEDRDVILPISVGIDNSVSDSRIITGIRYQLVLCAGDNIDGYAIWHSGQDKFSTLSVSVKYRFGGFRTYYR